MRILGIDPGITGAISHFIGGRLDEVIDMPVFDTRVDGGQIAEILAFTAAELVVIEDTQPMPKNGSIASFKLGLNTGIVIGAVQGHEVPLIRVRPSTWKRWAGLIGKPKDAARGLVIELYPQIADDVRLVKHQGRADAILIGRYGVYHQIQTDKSEEDDEAEPATVSDLQRHRQHHPSGRVS
jgi:crossover junction endodeoxyribonuclease RuvC